MSFVGRLDPDESLGEILAGLIMVLTFTLAAGVMSRDGEDGVHTVLFAAIGCNLAWGIIDAVFYVMTNVFIRRRRAGCFAPSAPRRARTRPWPRSGMNWIPSSRQ